MSCRIATHAGSWYTADRRKLNQELDTWLGAVTTQAAGCEQLPVPGARIVMAPHAGYTYSGPTAAYAYKAWDLSKAKRIIIFGPAHHVYINGCAVSGCHHYDTPLGQLTLDRDYIEMLKTAGSLKVMTTKTDQDEHSIEMQLPYIYKMIECAGLRHNDTKVVPIIVGSIDAAQEKEYGKALEMIFKDPANAVVVSTDFCHWGARFSYTRYFQELPSDSNSTPKLLETPPHRRPAPDPPIHASIKALDQQGMAAIRTGRHASFATYLATTKNTICGRHPIGLLMAGVEAALDRVPNSEEGKFRFIKYAQSEALNDPRGSSVSYVSGFMVL